MVSISKKVEHVLAARNHGGHHCHWTGCSKKVPPARWGCRDHWYALPEYLRRKIWQSFEPGQEISKTPSAEYLAVAREVQIWIATQGTEQRRNAAQGQLL